MRWFYLIACGVLIGLTACNSAKETLGFSRKAPDEFTVMTQRPLTVPPNFTLTQPGAATPATVTAAPAAQAADAVLGGQATAASSTGWQAMAQAFELPQRNAQIRTQLTKDNAGAPMRDPAFAERLAIWQQQHPLDPTVDAPKEAARLKKQGRKINGQNVPTQGGKVQAPLENVF